MKLNRLAFACAIFSLFLFGRFLESIVPPLLQRLIPFSQPVDSNVASNPTPTDTCKAARPAIVTIFAGAEIGTGSVISPDGLIITNEHVVREVGSGQVRARRWGGNLYQGQVLATDSIHDLALVKLNTQERLQAIPLAGSGEIQNGQAVCALGSPRAMTGVLARGTLIGSRGINDLKSAILLHPGNSGGPLLNTSGELIGVNKSIWLSEAGENVGLSFATKVTVAQAFIAQNRDRANRFTFTESPISLHVDPSTNAPKPLSFPPLAPLETPANTYTPAPPPPTGAHLGAIVDGQSLVLQIIEPESPAENAGLNAGDRLVAVNGERLERSDDLKAFLARKPDSAVFTIKRQQQQQDVHVNFLK